ncbi:MAG: hypothetical protein ACRCTP_04755 [Aeromonas popoffii]|uniref:hypothetical protein n=1 Tax=Aeromonas popoffii TaxID=70856 RepID=UPI003F3B3F99
MQLLSNEELVLMYHLLNEPWVEKSVSVPSKLHNVLRGTDDSLFHDVDAELQSRGISAYNPEF